MDYRKSRKENAKITRLWCFGGGICASLLVGTFASGVAASTHASAVAVDINEVYTQPAKDDMLTGSIILDDSDDDTNSSGVVYLNLTSWQSADYNVEDVAASFKLDSSFAVEYTEETTTEQPFVTTAVTTTMEETTTTAVETTTTAVETTTTVEETTTTVVETTAPVTTTIVTEADTTVPATASNDTRVIKYDNLYLDTSDVRKPSNMTLEQLQKWTQRFAPNWVGLESSIIEYDKRVNLVFLLAVARAETGAGSKSALVGKYNCFNIRGKGGSYVNYSSYLASIADFVDLLERAYLTPDGIYFNGYGINDIGARYAGAHWGPGVIKLADELIWHFEAGSLSH